MTDLPNHIVKDGVGWYVVYAAERTSILRVDGPICNKCYATLSSTGWYRKYKCPKCSKEYQVKRDLSDIKYDARGIAEGLIRSNFVTGKLYGDVSFVETKKIKSGNKWLEARLAIEGEVPGDIHIFIGDNKNKEGSKTHIVVSPKGDVRTHLDDEDPKANVKEIKVEMLRNDGNKQNSKTVFHSK